MNIKLFPSSDYKIEITGDSSIVLENLRQNTKLTDSLVSVPTDKAFIGQVLENRFKVFLSEIGFGPFCVLIGELQGNEGVLKLRIHRAFKIMSMILMFLPVIAMALSLLRRDLNNSIGLIFPVLLGIIFIRYVFLKLSFRIISKKGLKRLTPIIRIVAIENLT